MPSFLVPSSLRKPYYAPDEPLWKAVVRLSYCTFIYTFIAFILLVSVAIVYGMTEGGITTHDVRTKPLSAFNAAGENTLSDLKSMKRKIVGLFNRSGRSDRSLGDSLLFDSLDQGRLTHPKALPVPPNTPVANPNSRS